MHPGCILFPVTMPHLPQGIDRNIFLLHIMPSPVIDRIQNRKQCTAVFCQMIFYPKILRQHMTLDQAILLQFLQILTENLLCDGQLLEKAGEVGPVIYSID